MSATVTAPTSSSPERAQRPRPNPCLRADGEPRLPRLDGWAALLFEGRPAALPPFALAAVVIAALGAGAFALLETLTGDATGALVVIWTVVAVGAWFLWHGSRNAARFGWMVLGAIALTVLSQIASGAGDTVAMVAGLAGHALLVTVPALVVLCLARAQENRASGRARQAAWAVELLALAAAAVVFALLLPAGLLVKAGVAGLALLLLAPQALALARGEVRVGQMASASPAALGPGDHSAAVGASEGAPQPVPAAGGADDAALPAKAPAPKPERLEDLLAELDSYIGLEAAKRQVHDLVAFLRVQRAREREGMKAASGAAHMRFEGAPGTGKTEVARLVARILASLGVVERARVTEVSRADLVGRFQGHTADAVRAKCVEAEGGVLFVDEAYALAGGEGDSFGSEAVAELLKHMEDKREQLVVILAGYPGEMAKLMSSNPGLRSRVQRVLTFPDFEREQLVAIAQRFANESDYMWSDGALEELRRALAALHAERDEDWGNAREVRKLYQLAIRAHGRRLGDAQADKDELCTLTVEDVHTAAELYRAERDTDRAGKRQAQPRSAFGALR